MIVDAGRVVVEGSPGRAEERTAAATPCRWNWPTASAAALPALGRLPGLRDASADGTRLRARADSGARAVPAVLAALDEVGAEVASVTVARPSLDDVYLRHVGRAFQEVAA